MRPKKKKPDAVASSDVSYFPLLLILCVILFGYEKSV